MLSQPVERSAVLALSWTALARGALPRAGRDDGMAAAVEPRDARCYDLAAVA